MGSIIKITRQRSNFFPQSVAMSIWQKNIPKTNKSGKCYDGNPQTLGVFYMLEITVSFENMLGIYTQMSTLYSKISHIAKKKPSCKARWEKMRKKKE